MRTVTIRFPILALVGALSLFGCSRGRDPEYERELRAFADAYYVYVGSTRLAPADLNDLKASWGNFPRVREEILAGQFIVEWGASVQQTAAENDKYILGYEAGAPESGGIVLLGGGTVRELTAEEFSRLGRFQHRGQPQE
jgi:hypothetical protein